MPWEQLISIRDENRKRQLEHEQDPPIACPIDGTILDVHQDGRRNCPMGNYQWPRDGKQ